MVLSHGTGVRIPVPVPTFAKTLASLAGFGWQASVKLRASAKVVHRSRERSERLAKVDPPQYVHPSPRKDRTRPRAFPSPNEQRSAAHEAGTTGATIRRFCQLTLLAVITSSNEKAFLAALGALHKLTTSSLE